MQAGLLKALVRVFKTSHGNNDYKCPDQIGIFSFFMQACFHLNGYIVCGSIKTFLHISLPIFDKNYCDPPYELKIKSATPPVIW
jgi:hypothetical protein